MCCLLALIALGFPRIALILVWLLNPVFLDRAYSNMAVPILGLIFFPVTTLAYAWTYTFEGGPASAIGIIVIILAVIMDLGTYGGAGSRRRPTPK